MQLTLFTDYCFRVLIYLAQQPQRRVTVTELTDYYGISRHHLVKVVHWLGRQGYVTTSRGKQGGLCLARPAQDINIGAGGARHRAGLRPGGMFRCGHQHLPHPAALRPGRCADGRDARLSWPSSTATRWPICPRARCRRRRARCHWGPVPSVPARPGREGLRQPAPGLVNRICPLRTRPVSVAVHGHLKMPPPIRKTHAAVALPSPSPSWRTPWKTNC